ncbi:eCIS core domain-containing protein [Streptomyces sp. CA-251387]|uniref:eCIS core domain-containing protein n=1 Tax=Streptomyces sp. CA-251387 TaxID=3240064 RepID=UPI003D930866
MVAGRQLKQQDKQGQEKPKGSPTTSGKDTQLVGKFSTLEGKRNQDVEGLEEETEDDPFGSGSESEVEAGGEEPSAWDIKLRPEDFLPQQDLDVSGVPTADALDPDATPALPSFPAPPPTRADEVQAQRDAEDAEDAAAEAEPEEQDLGTAEAESAAPETEGGPDGDGGFGGLELERAAAPPPSSAASRDPKAGDDPKLGAVAAQRTVQEAPGKSDGKSEGGSAAKEPAAKEEKGTAAGGDKASAAPEKESPQATGGRAAQTDAAAGAKESAGGAGSEASGAQGAGAAQEAAAGAGAQGASGGPGAPGTPGASGGSDSASAETSGAAGTGAGGSSDTPATGGAVQESGPQPSARTETSAARTQTSAAPKSAPAPAPKAAREERGAPETAPSPKASASSSRPTGGGGGGGGGASAPARGKGKKDSAPAPNLSGVAPEAGLATASKLKPHKALQAMGGVGGAVDRTVGDEHKTLASAPPSMQRPAGAPQTLEGKPKTDAPAEYSQAPAEQAKEPDQENAEVTGAKEPDGQIEAEKAEEPGGWDTFKMALGFIGGKIVNAVGSLFGADEPLVDPQELAAKFAGLPTKDEALKQAQAGNAPGVEMQGGAEQASTEQGGNVDAKGQETIGTAQDDAGRGMGEDQVYPNAPKEQLTAKVPGQGGGGQGAGVEGGGATGAVPPEAASEVAEHERGPQFQAAFSEGQKGMSEGRQAKDRDFRDSQAKHKQQVDAEIAANTETQAGEREKAMAEVTAQREDWRTEQDKELKNLGDKKSDRQEKVRQDVKTEEKKTDDRVETEKEGSDRKIKEQADNAERDADKKKNDAAQESGNWLSKAFEWIKQKVIDIKNAIVKVIRDARNAVINFIRDFKKNVEGWINAARKAIVDAIKSLITDLIEFAKAMVRAIIDLAKRIRNLITSLINAAIALVNRLAAALKQAISDLLDAIGKLLSSILEILKKALLDVVKAVVAAVKAVLDFAAGLLSALGDFMLVAVDFLSDPGGWLSGAKNSAVDGAKNHLFREVKAAVKEWFQSKIEEIIGVPKAILDKLIKGGITLEQIVKETWDAIVPQLPFIIGEIVITKVIAKLIPGAGWVMAVIDAIRVAIGALGEILRAMGAVLDWLKAVRSGGAGILFAKAVAAGIVALLELAYEALLSGIGKYVAKVGRRFKNIAARLGQGGKGDGKRPAAGGADDKGGRNADPEGEKGAPAPGLPTAGTPKPGKSTGTKSNAKSDPKAGPTKPATRTPDKDTTPGPAKPKTDKDAPGRPTGTDTPGRPKKDSQGDKPDTRPTASPKPKPQPKPEPKPDAKPKGADAKSPDKPRDDNEAPATTRPKDGDGKSPDKPKDQDPKDQDPKRPTGDGKDTPGKPKDDKDAPGRPKSDTTPDGKKPGPKDDKDAPAKPKQKPDKDGPGKPKGKPDRPGPGKTKPRPDKSGPGRPKSRPDKDRQKKDENSDNAKERRLDLIVARIRRILSDRLDDGLSKQNHRGILNALRAHFKLTSLIRVGDPDFTVIATLNPTRPVLRGKNNLQGDVKDYLYVLSDPELPATKVPNFSNNNEVAHDFEAQYITKQYANSHGSTADAAPRNQPVGFRHLNLYGLNNDPSNWWVRMHLLSEQLGGPAAGTNLVPARGPSVNTKFKDEIEKHAYGYLGVADQAPNKKAIWYRIRVNYHPGPYEGFPSYLQARWGRHELQRHKNTSKWVTMDKSKGGVHEQHVTPEKPPNPGSTAKVTINSATKGQLKHLLDATPEFAQLAYEAIEQFQRDKLREITTVGELVQAILDYENARMARTGRKTSYFPKFKERLRELRNNSSSLPF